MNGGKGGWWSSCSVPSNSHLFLWLFWIASLQFSLKHSFEPWVKQHEPSGSFPFFTPGWWQLTHSFCSKNPHPAQEQRSSGFLLGNNASPSKWGFKAWATAQAVAGLSILHREDRINKPRILFATPTLLLQPFCLHQFLWFLSVLCWREQLLQRVGQEKCKVEMESLCTNSKTRLNVWLHNTDSHMYSHSLHPAWQVRTECLQHVW